MTKKEKLERDFQKYKSSKETIIKNLKWCAVEREVAPNWGHVNLLTTELCEGIVTLFEDMEKLEKRISDLEEK